MGIIDFSVVKSRVNPTPSNKNPIEEKIKNSIQKPTIREPNAAKELGCAKKSMNKLDELSEGPVGSDKKESLRSSIWTDKIVPYEKRKVRRNLKPSKEASSKNSEPKVHRIDKCRKCIFIG